MTAPTATDQRPRVLDAAAGERARFFADEIVVKERRPQLDIWHATVHAGCEPPLHVHRREDEWLHVLEGGITAFGADGEETSVVAGALVYLPRGIAHTYAVDSGSARIVAVNSPGGFAGMFAEIERAIGPDMPAAPRPADGAAIGPVFDRYGIDVVGPNPRYA